MFIPPSVIHYGRSVYKITDMYMKFELSCFKCKPRTSEALVSPPRTLDTDHCLSFWVYMYTTIASLTHIGALKVRVYQAPSSPSDYTDTTNGNKYLLIQEKNSICISTCLVGNYNQ